MNVLSLFAGIGGLDLGLERAGMTVVGQVEIDPYCQRILAKHWPEVPRHDDVRTCVQWWQSQPRPTVDLIAGGFPCQPVSIAGHRLAQDDDRWLWPAYADVIRQLRPRYALLENVPGLLVRGLGDVLGDLAEIGYDVEWDCVSAGAVGAPHRRDRWFGVAYTSPQTGWGNGAGRWGGRAGNAATSGDVADADSTGSQGRRGSESRTGERAAATCRAADGTGNVADAQIDGWGQRRAGGPTRGSSDRQTERAETLANTDSSRRNGWPRIFRQGRRGQPTNNSWWATQSALGGSTDGLSAELDGTAIWERGIPRVAIGVPHRVDRLRALGNAVVPQVAEHVGQLIVEYDEAQQAVTA